MRYISMFSGIEAASVALEPLGFIPHRFSELPGFASEVLAYRYPHVPNVGDMTQHDWSQYRGQIDLVIGGPPCQAFSIAGMRGGLSDDRGNLSLQFVKAVHAIRPRYLIAENVPGWLNMPDNAFGCFLAGLVGASVPLSSLLDRGRWPSAGMVAGPWARVAWRVLDAQHFGLAQRRQRVFVVAGFGDGADPAEILFEPKSLQGHPAARRKKGEDIAPTISARTTGGGGLGTDFDLDGGLIASDVGVPVQEVRRDGGCDVVADMRMVQRGTVAFGGNNTSGSIDVATAVNAKGGSGRMDFESETLIAFSSKDYGNDARSDVAPTLRAMGHNESHANAGGQLTVAFALRGRDGGAMPEIEGDAVGALRSASGRSTRSYVAAFHKNQRAEITLNDTAGSLKVGGGKPGQGYPAITGNFGVRRLTPRECERLQGFPDNWTQIPRKGKPASDCPDGPRYKAIGNSFPVPVIRWIGERMMAQYLRREVA